MLKEGKGRRSFVKDARSGSFVAAQMPPLTVVFPKESVGPISNRFSTKCLSLTGLNELICQCLKVLTETVGACKWESLEVVAVVFMVVLIRVFAVESC